MAVCGLASGAALLGAIFGRLPMSLTLTACVGVAASLGALTWRRVPPAARPWLCRRALMGALAGVAGTIGYDASRQLLVTLTGLTVKPFEALPLFGQLIAGSHAPYWLTLVVGTGYHYLNGIAFGAAYGVLLAGRGWWTGVLWALGLECLMLAVYPVWLGIGALLPEFTAMSLLGHLTYGTTLGMLCQRWWTAVVRVAR